ncbi:hypothetical protein IW136_006119, partial [Coemansia sp. RSA 678]
ISLRTNQPMQRQSPQTVPARHRQAQRRPGRKNRGKYRPGRLPVLWWRRLWWRLALRLGCCFGGDTDRRRSMRKRSITQSSLTTTPRLPRTMWLRTPRRRRQLWPQRTSLGTRLFRMTQAYCVTWTKH